MSNLQKFKKPNYPKRVSVSLLDNSSIDSESHKKNPQRLNSSETDLLQYSSSCLQE